MNYTIRKGVIPLPKGGLGNQIFIYIAAYISSLKNNLPLYIFINPLSNNKHNHNKLDYNYTIFKYIGIHIDQELSDILIHHLLQNDYRMECVTDNAFKLWFPQNINPGTLMNSYYQYLPPIIEYEDEIRTILLKGLVNVYPQEKINSKSSVFLHIRRGDYCDFSDIHYIQPLSYYIEGINIILKLNPTIETIYITTDDINWVKEQPVFESRLFNILEQKNELETLCIMSQCHGGAICANSSFSWWGAFLGAHGKRAPVIIPKKWINLAIVDLFPKEWIII
jgi:hypothetical protein